MSGGKGLGKSWLLKSILTFVCSPSSWQRPLMAATGPRYSSFVECNSCDKVWISVAISLACFCNSPIRMADFSQIRRVLVELFQLDGQQCETLTNVVVKLSGDPVTLLLLRLNQPAAHVCERRFRQFALRNIRYHAYNPQHFALFVEVRATGSLHPNHTTVGTCHAMADSKVGLFSAKRSIRGQNLSRSSG
jgi:hypothetical protein